MPGGSSFITAQAPPADPGLARLKRMLTAALRREDMVAPACEAKVHAAIDGLAGRGCAAERARVEAISLFLHKLRMFRRQGQVNAYASTRLRLQRAVEAL